MSCYIWLSAEYPTVSTCWSHSSSVMLTTLVLFIAVVATFLFLCISQFRLAVGIMFLLHNVCPFVVANDVYSIFSKRMKRSVLLQIDTNDPQGDDMINCWDQKIIKGQGHVTPKLDLQAWRRHHSRPIRSSKFSSFGPVILTFNL